MSDCELDNFDFYAYVLARLQEVFEESDRAFVEYAAELGYVKPVRCKDCGSFMVTFEGEGIEPYGVCSYFEHDVPGKHYCSYAWIDEFGDLD